MERDLQALEMISLGKCVTYGIVERMQGTCKYFSIAYGKEIIAAGLTELLLGFFK